MMPDDAWLELVRPERGDPAARPTAEQAAALARDPALRAELARRTLFDEAVAAVVRDVPVPAGLVARLSKLDAKPLAAAPVRRWLPSRRAALAAGLAVVLGAGLWQRFGPESSWTPERVAAEALAFHHQTKTFDAEPAVADALPERFDRQWVEHAGRATFLGRAANVLRLKRGGRTATLALLSPMLFPRGFDFNAYVAFGPGEPEAAFLLEGGWVCVAIARDLAAFERQDAAL